MSQNAMEQRSARQRKMNIPEEREESPGNVPQAPAQSLDPYEYLRPPFEEDWSEDPYPPAPIAPAVPEQREEESEEVLYFAYGKDMDPALLSDSTCVAVGKLSMYSWVMEQSKRFPMVIPSEQDHVYGLVYRLSQGCLAIQAAKAKKRGLKIQEIEVELYEKSGMPGFWNAPLIPLGECNVQVMVGTMNNAEKSGEGEAEEGTLEGSKKRKILGGLLWGASEGLPEHWKAEIKGKLGGIKGPEDMGYWSAEQNLKRGMGKRKQREENGPKEAEVRRSKRLKGKDTGKKHVTFASELDN
ncbi:hypothetical protein BGZ57DRAFT_987716 [Hyaloscypha finlandica]|nr:hypothetical protein BGZ57DRAFT_987716 [Hyaloscypha finlandica]